MYLLVLMHRHKIEPIALLRVWSEELDFSISERSKHSFISDIAHAVERELGAAFLQENWLHLDVVGFGRPPVVVD